MSTLIFLALLDVVATFLFIFELAKCFQTINNAFCFLAVLTHLDPHQVKLEFFCNQAWIYLISFLKCLLLPLSQ